MIAEGGNNSVCKAWELGNAASEGLESKGEWMEMNREGEEAARKVEGDFWHGMKGKGGMAAN